MVIHQFKSHGYINGIFLSIFGFTIAFGTLIITIMYPLGSGDSFFDPPIAGVFLLGLLMLFGLPVFLYGINVLWITFKSHRSPIVFPTFSDAYDFYTEHNSLFIWPFLKGAIVVFEIGFLLLTWFLSSYFDLTTIAVIIISIVLIVLIFKTIIFFYGNLMKGVR